MEEMLDAIVAALSDKMPSWPPSATTESSRAVGDKAADITKNGTAAFTARTRSANVYLARTTNTRFGIYKTETDDRNAIAVDA